mmetsp:Transcript_15568/g.29366  ORF Transcript_15568/g.29366 Transcript_15568/m.29366 type:complete len:92 (+) Transcript_15568:677-952(+)
MHVNIISKTYFLQLYLGLTPRLAQASLRGDPGLKSFFFPLYVRTVILRSVEIVRACCAKVVVGAMNAWILESPAVNRSRHDMNTNLDVIII